MRAVTPTIRGRTRVASAATTALIAALLVGCGGSASDAEPGQQARASGADPEASSVPMISVEQALANAALSPTEFDDDAMALSASRVKQGDALSAALERLGRVLGTPQHAEPGVINWLKRMGDGDCGNLMLIVEEGALAKVAYTEYPEGSMGEAKCQNWLR